PLLAPVKGAERREVGHVRLEVGRAGGARVKRMIYPPGFRWSVDMKPVVGTDLCMHAHVGFLACGEIHIVYVDGCLVCGTDLCMHDHVGFIAWGEIHIEYADGCIVEYKAPQVVAIDPGHDGWVVGREPVILIEFDFEGDTVSRLGMRTEHGH